jgi:hypothetical protein
MGEHYALFSRMPQRSKGGEQNMSCVKLNRFEADKSDLLNDCGYQKRGGHSMLIVWGKHIIRRKLGWVAEFCPTCRGPARMKAVEVRSIPHLYFIPVWVGTPVLYERQCCACGLLLGSRQLSYPAYERRRSADIFALVAATAPDFTTRYAARLQLEERVTHGELLPQERERLIKEPLAALEYQAQSIAKRGDIPVGKGLLMVFSLCLAFAAMALWTDPSVRAWAIAATVLAAVLVPYSFLSIHKGETASRAIMPRLAKCLAPLDPAKEELESAIASLKAQGFAVARFVKVNRLLDAVKKARDRAALEKNYAGSQARLSVTA